MHLLFYDGNCGLCDHFVQFVLHHDIKKVFLFAPLKGETAARMLKIIPEEFKTSDSLILIENYQSGNEKLYLFSKAVFRICWYLGSYWKVPGLLSWFPSCFFDWGYRLIAKNRHRFFNNSLCILPSEENKNRFLP